jgi:hypothetical protein
LLANALSISSSTSDFNAKIENSDVRYLDFLLNKEQESMMISNPQFRDLFQRFTDYFKQEFGFTGAIITNNQRTEVYSNRKSICEILLVNLTLGDFQSQFMAVGYYDLKMAFLFCDNQGFVFESQLNVNGATPNFARPVKRGLDKTFRTKPKAIRNSNNLTIQRGEIVSNASEIRGVFRKRHHC